MTRLGLSLGALVGLSSGCADKATADSAPPADSAADSAPPAADSGGEDTAPPGDPCLPGDDPWLMVGEGEAAFSEFQPGDPVELVHGPQGGYHVTLAIRAGYLDNSAPWIVRLAAVVEGEVLAESVPYANAFCNPSAAALDAWNLLLIFDEGLEPEDLHGRLAVIEASVTDPQVVVVEATTELTIHDPALE